MKRKTWGTIYSCSPPEDPCPIRYPAYAKTYCWVRNTYYVPMPEQVPKGRVDRERLELSYYQWVPIILLFMALLFKLPSICWRLLSGASGIDLDRIVCLTLQSQLGEEPKYTDTVNQIADYMDRWLDAHRQYHWNVMVRIRQKISKLCCFCFGKRHGSYLSGLYLVVKMAYCVNVVCQFFLLNGFMGGWFNIFGLELLTGLYQDRQWRESPYFPKVTLCDFEIRQLNNVQPWTFQCALPINLFNEQIFSFLWFWFILVAVLTLSSLLLWLLRALFRNTRATYVRKFLKAQGELTTEEDKQLAERFADHYLRDDGIFVLRVVASNSNNVVISDLTLHLWRIYKNKPLVRNGEEVMVYALILPSSALILPSSAIILPSSVLILPSSAIILPSSVLILPSSALFILPSSALLILPSSALLILPSSALLILPSSVLLILPSSAIILPSSAIILPSSALILPSSAIILPSSALFILPSSALLILPSSALLILPSSALLILPSSAIILPSSALILPSNAIILPSSTLLIPPSSALLILPSSALFILPSSALLILSSSALLILPSSALLILPSSAIILPSSALLIPPSSAIILPSSAIILPSSALILPSSALFILTYNALLILPSSALILPSSALLIPPSSALLIPPSSALLILPSSALLILPSSALLIPPSSALLIPPSSALLILSSGTLLFLPSSALILPSSALILPCNALFILTYNALILLPSFAVRPSARNTVTRHIDGERSGEL
ncbi:hypothetical protein ACOMHN_025111 [Nucella lapillus]